jgi:hypothetical protein
MAHWRTRKDGSHYRVKENMPNGVSRDTFDKLQNQDAKRTATARNIDKGIRAPLDLTGERWAKKPNHYDFPGIDDPKTTKPNPFKELDDSFRKSKYFKLVE